MATARNAPSVQSAASSFDVLDARCRVALELSSPLPQQELNGGEVALLNVQVFAELGPGKGLKVFATDLEGPVSVTARTFCL